MEFALAGEIFHDHGMLFLATWLFSKQQTVLITKIAVLYLNKIVGNF